MTVAVRRVRYDERIGTLLKGSDLPTDDLANSPNVVLFSHAEDDYLCGVVGLELYGSCGLLRSLAVTPARRGEGIGEALLAHAEQAAAASGVKELYLLTTTAERYFAAHGYSRVDRVTAPAEISRTRQFSELCPSSSAFMVKKIQATGESMP
jgi:amino-acid N-acetyltransferase